MENKSDPKPKTADRKPFFASGAVWILVLMVLAILIVVTYTSSAANVEVRYSDLLDLIAKSKTPDGSITVTVGAPGNQKKVQFSKLQDVVIEKYRVVGSVERQVLDSDKEPARVAFFANKSESDESEKELKTALKDAAIDFDHPEAPGVWRNYLPMIVVTALFVLVIFLMMRRLGGAGSPMAFGRSRGKMYAQEDLGITFEDVAGIDEAVEELREVVEFLKTPEKYQSLGGRIPKGVLLVGPPGTGKTLLAKAIAGEAGVPVLRPLGLRLRRDVCRRRRGARPRHVPAGRSQGPLHHLHRRA